MIKGGTILSVASVLAITACGSDKGKLEVRAIPAPVSASAKPVPIRIAEAHAHLALGNVALALESYRKAAREDPRSVDALMGMADCYDRMQRFDLSRRNYEAALAVAPSDAQVLGRFAASLDLQGRRGQAAAVRAEIAQRLAAQRSAAPIAIAAAKLPAPAPIAKPALAPAEQLPPTPAKPAIAAARPTTAPRSAVPMPARAVETVVKLAKPVPIAVAAKPRPQVAAMPAAKPAAPVASGPEVKPQPQSLAAAPVLKPQPPSFAAAPAVKPQPQSLAAAPAAQPPKLAETIASAPESQRITAQAPAPAASVTITLPPAKPAPAAKPALPAEPAPPAKEAPRAEIAEQRLADSGNASPRLERLSLGEVALVTSGRPTWRPQVVQRTARSTTVRFVPLRRVQTASIGVKVLNAARYRGLAARTRSYLAQRGWRQMAIGDARKVRETSLILYPASRRATAQRLAAQFGFAVATKPSGREIVLLLGRDAATARRLRNRG